MLSDHKKCHTWRCPVCNEPLIEEQQYWGCKNGHRFDNAKQGYVNLLLTQNKNSKQPGDNNAMVQARRAFLNQGFYEPVAHAIAELLIQNLPVNSPISALQEPFRLFDAGCGEGYYLDNIQKILVGHLPAVLSSGIDISKAAIQKAAKTYKRGYFAVASSYHIPLGDHSQNAVIQVFAPSSPEHIYRVLASDGLWITVNPGPSHLSELKHLIYDTPQRHTVNHQVPDKFALVSTKELAFELHLETEELRLALLMMTPFFWTVSDLKKQLILKQLKQVSTDFSIKVFKKINECPVHGRV